MTPFAFIVGCIVGGIAVGVFLLMKMGNRQVQNERRELEQINQQLREKRQKLPVLFKVRDIVRNSKDSCYPKDLFDELVSLVSMGADLEATDEQGNTALLESIGLPDVPEFLIKKGASIIATTKEGDSALHLSCLRGRISTARLLIERQAAVNAKNHEGTTPLHFACLSGQVDCVELLIQGGADVQTANKQGEDPLFWAARKPSLQCLKLLVRCGANPSRANLKGENAFSILDRTMKAGDLAGSLPHIDSWMIERANDFNEHRVQCAEYLKACIEKNSAKN